MLPVQGTKRIDLVSQTIDLGVSKMTQSIAGTDTTGVRLQSFDMQVDDWSLKNLILGHCNRL